MNRRRILLLSSVSAAIALVLILILSSGRSLPEKRFSCEYLYGKPSYFISIKDLRKDSALLSSLRLVSFPMTGKINAWLYPLEYVLDHNLTPVDISDLLGSDFTLQIRPKFLLITRTKREFNFFYYVRIRSDPEIRYRGFVISVKSIHQTGRTIYYTFTPGYLFITEDLRTMKRALTARYPQKPQAAGTESRFMIHDTIGKSGLGVLFRTRPIILYGDSLNDLSLKRTLVRENTFFDSTAQCQFNLDLRTFTRSWTPLWGKFIIREFTYSPDKHGGPGRLEMKYALLIPKSFTRMTRKRIEDRAAELFNTPSEPWFEYETGSWLVRANTTYVPDLQETGALLSVDLTTASSWGFLDPPLAEFLKRYGRIAVRPGN
jgi:hypothetical protein